MECRRQANLKACNCTYKCSRRGFCCECVRHHREAGELPACYFTEDAERTYDRSIVSYLKTRV